MTAINKLIEIAKNEVGYLEKASNSSLDSKTANAGQNNYTKYWRDIKPSYQGEPWCACFVTWCFVQAFGEEMTEKLLKHYPYVYCPTMAELFTLNANPKVGDIVIFKRSGTFTHTGIVIEVANEDGDPFTTIEGNTSGGSTIIANGGGVCQKTYYNSNLPGTKFVRPDYSIIESEELTMTQYEELKSEIETLTEATDELKAAYNPMIYNYIDDNTSKIAEDANECLTYLVSHNILKGTGEGLNLNENMIRQLVMLYRAKVFGNE